MEDFREIHVKKGRTKVKVVRNPTSHKFIGKGVQGAVFQLSANRCVKIYPLEKDAISEQEALKAIQGSIFFPKLFEAGRNYVVIEYIQGPDLQSYLKEKGEISKSISYQLLGMLKEMKRLGIPRCDKNLRHIIVSEDEKLKVIDHVNTFKKKVPVPRTLIRTLDKLGYLNDFLTHVKDLDHEIYLQWKKARVIKRFIKKYDQ